MNVLHFTPRSGVSISLYEHELTSSPCCSSQKESGCSNAVNSPEPTDSGSLTSAGLDELARARQVGSAIFARMLADFDADEIAAFADYLSRCITSLGGDLALASEQTAAPRRSQRRQNAGVNSTRNV